jgi:hypothetical protein
MVDGMGRNLLTVLGVSSIPQAMAALRTRCNGTGTPDFRGLLIGDYIDGLDLSGVTAAPGGTAPQGWNNTYKNNRIILSGFNTYKGSGDTETSKNHVLFTFRNVICQGYMNPTNTNAGGYSATELRAWLEGALGDGSGPLATKLKAVLGGEYLLPIRRMLADKGQYNWGWITCTLFLPTEHEVTGNVAWGEIGYDNGIGIHFPIYQKSSVYRIKRYNGALAGWWLGSPAASNQLYFLNIYGNGLDYVFASDTASVGVAPAFCVA